MAIAIKGLLALFWLVAVPFAAGIPFLQKKQKCMAPEYLLVGYLVLFSVTEVLTLFATWKKLPLHLLTMGYGGISLILSVVGILCFAKNKRHLSDIFAQNTSVYFWMAVLVIVFQTVMCVFLAHMDADDCMYVANATTSVHTDTVFQINIRVYAFAKQAFGRYFELGQNGLHHAFFLLKTRFLAIAVISSMPLILAPIKKVASPIVPIAASLRIKIPMWGVGKQRFSAVCVP